jgi:hypothetical protein
MKEFLRENWLYIVAPLVIVLVGIVVILVLSNGAESPFTYNVH